ncbi:transposase, MuDR, MULE transposase domain protein, partial [Tanacetum coccineum]
MSFPSQFKFKVTLVFQSSKRQVLLPKDIDYHGLLAYVQKKFDITSIHDFSLYYKCGLEVFEVKDEDDVQFFVNEVCGQSEIVQKLCVRKIKEHKQRYSVKCVQPDCQWNVYTRKVKDAVGMDGNNQILPLATGVSEGETGESWTWFLTKLKEQIVEPPNLCIISDRHAAIIQACGT